MLEEDKNTQEKYNIENLFVKENREVKNYFVSKSVTIYRGQQILH